MTTATTHGSSAVHSRVKDAFLAEIGKVNGAAAPGTKKAEEEETVSIWAAIAAPDLTETSTHKKWSTLFGKLPKGSPDFLMEVFEKEAWSKGMQTHLQNADPHYVVQVQECYEICLGLEYGDKIMVYGPTGSGKTSLIQYICAKLGRPFLRINGRGDMESGPVFGQLTVQDGGTVWQDGIITEGYKEGAVILFDEPWLVPPEITMGLNSVLEEPSMLVLSDKPGSMEEKVVSPHKQFRMVFADNTGGLGDTTGAHAGVNVQNTATLNRFGTVTHIGYMPRAAEVKLLGNKFPDLPTDTAKLMVQMAGLVRKSYEQGELSLTLSPRDLISWAWKSIHFRNTSRALRMCYLKKFNTDNEVALITNHYRTVFSETL